MAFVVVSAYRSVYAAENGSAAWTNVVAWGWSSLLTSERNRRNSFFNCVINDEK
jgi:hypothetical protein